MTLSLCHMQLVHPGRLFSATAALFLGFAATLMVLRLSVLMLPPAVAPILYDFIGNRGMHDLAILRTPDIDPQAPHQHSAELARILDRLDGADGRVRRDRANPIAATTWRTVVSPATN